MKPETAAAASAEAGWTERLKALLRQPFFWVLLILAVLCLRSCTGGSPLRGYYGYGDDIYYNQSGHWFIYDEDHSSWLPAAAKGELSGHPEDYYLSGDGTGLALSPFSDSVFYDPEAPEGGPWRFPLLPVQDKQS